jgi:hypothetical protein
MPHHMTRCDIRTAGLYIIHLVGISLWSQDGANANIDMLAQDLTYNSGGLAAKLRHHESNVHTDTQRVKRESSQTMIHANSQSCLQ